MFELERALLGRRGHEVRLFVRHSDDLRARGVLGTVRGALATPWNPWTVPAVRRVLREFRPDVVHAHNTFPLISPSLFLGVGTRAARVLTLHNYRLFCPAAIPLRNGLPCTRCLDRHSVLPALRYGCYRGSRIATLPLAGAVALGRAMGTWEKHVDAFVALTEFQRALLVRAGLPVSRVLVKPNFYPGRPDVIPWAERRPCVVFVGRLSGEKGADVLLDAWASWGADAPELRVVGDGPLRGALEAKARELALTSVRFLGRLAPHDAEREIAQARLLVMPSICFEGFPLVLREAFAFGTPAVASDIGPLPDLVGSTGGGVTFAAGQPRALAECVRTVWRNPEALESMSRRARKAYEVRYSEDANGKALEAIYQAALAVRDERARA